MHATDIYTLLDPALIWMFRLPGEPVFGFWFGLIYVSVVATLVGEAAMALAYRINRRHFRALKAEMVRNHNLSMEALASQDKASYKACNSLANEAFGKNFFSGLALFAASVWPAFLVLGWLDYRFGEVVFAFPFTEGVGPNFFFAPMYIAIRVVVARSRPHLPGLARVHRLLKDDAGKGEELKTFFDIIEPQDNASRADRDGAARSSGAAGRLDRTAVAAG